MSQQAIGFHQREINRRMAERGMPTAAWSAEKVAYEMRRSRDEYRSHMIHENEENERLRESHHAGSGAGESGAHPIYSLDVYQGPSATVPEIVVLRYPAPSGGEMVLVPREHYETLRASLGEGKLYVNERVIDGKFTYVMARVWPKPPDVIVQVFGPGRSGSDAARAALAAASPAPPEHFPDAGEKVDGA